MIQPPDHPSTSTTSEGLALPRPNLGPEPMDSGGSLIQPAIALLGGLIVLTVLAILWRRWRSTRRAAEPAETTGDDSPEAQLLALRERARALLAARLDPALRARTTEELANDPRVADALGEDNLDQLTALLRAGDQLLFSGDFEIEADDGRAPDLSAWSELLDAIARSRLDYLEKKRAS